MHQIDYFYAFMPYVCMELFLFTVVHTATETSEELIVSLVFFADLWMQVLCLGIRYFSNIVHLTKLFTWSAAMFCKN